MKIAYKITKIYADGHLWTDNSDFAPEDIEAIYHEDPSLVAIVITRNIRRDA